MPQVTHEVDNTGVETAEMRVEEGDKSNSVEEKKTSGQKGSAMWFIGLTPSEYGSQQHDGDGGDGGGEGVMENLSQYDVFFPELFQVSCTCT